MKVMHHVTKYLPPSQTFVRDVIAELEHHTEGMEVICHGVMDDGTLDPYPITDISLGRIPVWRRKLRNRLNRLRSFAPNIDFARWHKALNRFCPDVTHCHFGTAGYYHAKCMDRYQKVVPTIVSFHGYDVFWGQRFHADYTSTISKLAEGPTIFTCPSEYLADQVIQTFHIPRSRLKVVRNGFNPDLFTWCTTPSPGKRLTICSVARFIPVKGHEYLVEAVAILKRELDMDVHLKLIGDGEKLADAKELATALGLKNNVEFLGTLEHFRVAEHMKSSDIYVQASCTQPDGQAETFGVAILEAIAVGLPVVVTNSGGMKEIFGGIGSPMGQVVEERDSASLARGLAFVAQELKTLDVAEKQRFRESVLQLNNIQSTCRDLMSLYSVALSLPSAG